MGTHLAEGSFALSHGLLLCLAGCSALQNQLLPSCSCHYAGCLQDVEFLIELPFSLQVKG